MSIPQTAFLATAKPESGALWRDVAIAGAILLCAAALRLVFWGGGTGGDELVYLMQALRLLDGDWGRSNYVGAVRYGINGFTALSMLIFGKGEAGAAGLFVVCSLLHVLVLFVVAQRLWGRSAAVWAAILLAVLPIDVWLVGRLLPDAYLSLTITAALILFYLAEEKNSSALYLVAGLVAGWVFWIKDPVVVFVLAFLPLTLLREPWRLMRVWFAVGGAIMLAAHLALFWYVYGDPLHLFRNVSRTLQGAYVEQQLADTSLLTYFDYLFVRIYHTGLLGWVSLAAVVTALLRWRRLDLPTRYILVSGLAMLTLFTAFPISLSPLMFIAKQSNYMLIFLPPFCLLSGWFIARQRLSVQFVLGALIVAIGITASGLAQTSQMNFTANGRAAVAYAAANADAVVFGTRMPHGWALLHDRLVGKLGADPLVRELVRQPLLFLHPPENAGARRVIVIVDHQTFPWGARGFEKELERGIPACWQKIGVLTPASRGAMSVVIDRARGMVAELLPEALSRQLLAASVRLAVVAPAEVYEVERNCG